jgi:hypothetical protein
VLALSALLVLGTLAAWLLNMPLWVIGAVLALGAFVIRRVMRSLSRSRARQDTEA